MPSHLCAQAEGACRRTGFLPPTGSGLWPPTVGGLCSQPSEPAMPGSGQGWERCLEMFQAGDAGVRQGWEEQVCQGWTWFLGLPSLPSGHVTVRAAEPMVPVVTGPGHSICPPGKARVTARLQSKCVLWGRRSPHLLCDAISHAHMAVAVSHVPGPSLCYPPKENLGLTPVLAD